MTSGEQVTSALIAGALNDLGIKSKSWLNWQIPIITEGEHSNSRIININIKDLEEDYFSLLMVRRLYGDSSTQINSPSISMLGAHKFIELNSITAKKYGINSKVGNLIQGPNSILINIDINEYLPDDLVIAQLIEEVLKI